jgi:hypothetical protein
LILQALEAMYVALRMLYRRGSETPSLIMFTVLCPVFMAILFLILGSSELWNIRVPNSTHSTVPLLALIAIGASAVFVATFLYRRREALDVQYAQLPSLKPVRRRVFGLSAIYVLFVIQALLAIRLPIVSLGIFVIAYSALGMKIRKYKNGVGDRL